MNFKLKLLPRLLTDCFQPDVSSCEGGHHWVGGWVCCFVQAAVYERTGEVGPKPVIYHLAPP